MSYRDFTQFDQSQDLPQIDMTPFTRDDIIQYNMEMEQHKAQAAQYRQELDYLMQDLRDAQFDYKKTIRDQDEKIRELTWLVVRLTNRVEESNGSGKA